MPQNCHYMNQQEKKQEKLTISQVCTMYSGASSGFQPNQGKNTKSLYQESFLLGRIIKIFISSNLQRRPRSFKEFFLLDRLIKIFIFSIHQRRPSIFREFFLLGKIIKILISSNLQRRPRIFKEFSLCLVE
jgi:hypothetical protein